MKDLGRLKILKKIELPQNILEKMKRLKKIYGEMSEVELIEALIDKKLKQIEVKNNIKTDKCKPTRYIQKSIRATIAKQANFQSVSIHSDGKRCQERQNLEYDHIHPFANGGFRDVANLQLLCRNYNARINFQSFGFFA